MNATAITARATQVQHIQAQFSELARQLPMPPETAPDRHVIAYQLFGLAFQHAVSIASHLQRHGPDLAASAFALVRPLYETLQRGWWFANCATDAQAHRFITHDEFLGGTLREVGAAIDAHDPFAGTDFFSRLSQQGEWSLYHSFTHGGMFALTAYGDRPNLDPNFDPEKILSILDNTAKMAAGAAFGMCWVCRIYDQARVDPVYEQVLALGPELGRQED